MATIANDTFTDVVDTLLENHTPDVGTAWQVQAIKTWVIGTVIANKVGSNTGGSNIAKETTDVGSADMKVTADVQLSDNVEPFGNGPMSRLPSVDVATGANQDGFAATLEGNDDKTGGDVVLFRVTDGSPIEIGRFNGNFGNNVVVAIRLESIANAHEVFVDGTSRIGPITDSAHNTNQFAGIYGHEDADLAALDNFLSESIDVDADGGEEWYNPIGIHRTVEVLTY